MTPIACVSLSGGKDSTATALLAMDSGQPTRFVFADTGNEHELTYQYVREYLPTRLGIKIDEVRADFARQIAGKRRFVAEKWPIKGVPQAFVDRVLAVLHPTGVPFLDLCMWKGRFPSRKAQFCTQELKRYPLEAFLLNLVRGTRDPIESWRGVRRDESQQRAGTLDRERMPEGYEVVMPIAAWTAAEVVKFVVDRGVELNPLYKLGMSRVGCMPCINCSKNELSEIANRFPKHIDRIRQWESVVSECSKRGYTTFFTDRIRDDDEGDTAKTFARCAIDARVSWSKTTRGGKQGDIFKSIPGPSCSSVYGLCE